MRLIDADKLFEDYAIKDAYKGNPFVDYRVKFELWEIRRIIIDAPTIDPTKRGRWKFDHMTGERAHYAYCSNCKAIRFWESSEKYFRYCPDCGAKMDLEE